jgi:hypothetical protein
MELRARLNVTMRFRIHRMKDTPRENFRWAAHTRGLAIVKPKEYELAETINGKGPYDVWKTLLADGRPLAPGDLIENLSENESANSLRIAKYIGFEPAQWFEESFNSGSVPALPATDSLEQQISSQSI